MTLGIRVEWNDAAGRTKTMYLMTSHKAGFHTESGVGMLHSHGLAIGILNHLENREIVQNRRPAVRRFHRALMYEIRFDHVRQAIRIEQSIEVLQKVDDGVALRSIASVNQNMVAVGAERVGEPHGVKLPSGSGRARSLCDRCLAADRWSNDSKGLGKTYGAISVRFRKCEKGSGGACKNCEVFGVECSWTLDVMKKPALLQALWFPPAPSNAIFDTEDPEIDQLMNRLDVSQIRQGSTGSQGTQSPSHSRHGSMGSQRPQSPRHSQQGSVGQQSPSHSPGSSPGSPASGARSRASTGNPPRPNVPVQPLLWVRPSATSSLRKNPFKNVHLYREENYFKGELTPAVRALANHQMAKQTAQQIATVTYPLFHNWVNARNQHGKGSTLSAEYGQHIYSAFRGLEAIFDHVRSRNLLDAADALAQLVANEDSEIDLWKMSSDQNAAAAAAPSRAPGTVRWEKPPRHLRKIADDLGTDYFEDTFRGDVSSGVPNHELAIMSAAALITKRCSPIFYDYLRVMNGSDSQALEAAKTAIKNIFRDLGRLHKVTKGRNLLDAGDWLAQKVESISGYDLWKDNSEEHL
jgi:hypothetical protein